MGEIAVNFAELEQVTSDLEQASQKIQQELDDLESGPVAQLAATWEGAAQDAYKQAQDEWNREGAKMHTTAQAMGKAVDVAREAFEAGEKKNAGRFGG